MTVSVETILALAEEARRSPHARRVLFDAMLERYGEAFERTIDRARAAGERREETTVMILAPKELEAAEDVVRAGRIPRWDTPSRHVIARAVWPVPLAVIRSGNRFAVSRSFPTWSGAREPKVVIMVAYRAPMGRPP